MIEIFNEPMRAWLILEAGFCCRLSMNRAMKQWQQLLRDRQLRATWEPTEGVTTCLC